MNTAEALDRLLLYRQTPESLLRRLMDPAETVRTAAQAELVALAVENGWQGDLWRCCIAWTLTEHRPGGYPQRAGAGGHGCFPCPAVRPAGGGAMASSAKFSPREPPG